MLRKPALVKGTKDAKKRVSRVRTRRCDRYGVSEWMRGVEKT